MHWVAIGHINMSILGIRELFSIDKSQLGQWIRNDRNFFLGGEEVFTCGSLASIKKGDAVWNTPTHPSTAASKEPSSKRSAFNKWSLSLAPSRSSKCFTFLGSSAVSCNFREWYTKSSPQKRTILCQSPVRNTAKGFSPYYNWTSLFSR